MSQSGNQQTRAAGSSCSRRLPYVVESTSQAHAPIHAGRHPLSFVNLYGKRYTTRARVHTISGYSAHAGQDDFVNFIRRMRKPPAEVRLVHGDNQATQTLRDKLLAMAQKKDHPLQGSIGGAWA